MIYSINGSSNKINSKNPSELGHTVVIKAMRLGEFRIDISKLYILTLHIVFFNEWCTTTPLIREYYAPLKGFVLALISCVFLINLIVSSYNAKEIGLIILSFACTLYTYYLSDVVWMFYLVFFIFFARNIKKIELINSVVKIMKNIFIINMIIFFIKFFWFYDTLVLVTSRNMIRYDMNFSTAGNAAKFWVLFVMACFLKEKGHFNKSQLLIQTLITVILFYFTRSEAVFLVVAVWTFGFFRSHNLVKMLIDILAKCSYLFYTIFSILSVNLYPNKFFVLINSLMTGRISLQQNVFAEYGYSMFGQNVELPVWITYSENVSKFLVLDNTFMSVLINYGYIYIVPLVIFPFIFLKNMEYIEKVVLVVFGILFLMHDGMLSPFLIFPFLIVACEYYNHRNRRNLKNGSK